VAPTHSPAKVANTKVPTPVTPMPANPPKMPSDSGLNSPVFTMPGAT